jgi:eukaryotic-like serine/threonine-protein kinase
MESLTGLLAVVMSLGIAPAIIFLRNRHKLAERRMELESQGRLALPAAAVDSKLVDENKKLRERVENLESIVCNVDFELNQKLSKLLDESKMQRPVASPVVVDAALAATETPHAATPAALDRTATAIAQPNVASKPASTRTGVLQPGQVLANRYRVARLLGRGGMGAVYLADDEVLSEMVALKVIAAASVAFSSADEVALATRFRREAAAARKVSSPSVIRIHDLGEAEPGLLYLSMEYFAGRTLSEVIAQRGIIPMADAIDMLGQICTGLAAAHEAGVIHRDLKPGNILVGERGAIKIIDFGLATMLSGEGLTMTGAMLGTPNYMSPEQVRGKTVDARSDIYALGALAYHIVCGRPPFTGDNAIAVGFAHCSDAVVAPIDVRKECPPRLNQAIVAALAKSPSDRPASAHAFRSIMDSAAE